MKKFTLVLLGSLVLVACGTAPSAPSAPSDAAQNTVQQDTGGYPYNPDANPVQQSDPRVPYYGNWSWLAGTSDGQFFSGDAAISQTILDPNKQLVNNGFGAYRWCSDLSCASVTEENIGSIATYPDGNGDLAAAMDVNETGSFRWVFIDSDKKVGRLAGLPYLDGVGYFNTPDGVRHSAYFVMVQTSTDPRVKTLPTPGAQQAMQNALAEKRGAVTSQSLSGELDTIQRLYQQFKQR